MADVTSILLIGGTQEAVQLNTALAKRPDVRLITSLAGRTTSPAALQGEVVTGGFGGADGLSRFLTKQKIDCVIDASHPFAAAITHTAYTVCKDQGIDFRRYQRPAWEPTVEDRWIVAGDMTAAADRLDGFARIFLTVGRQELAAFEHIENRFFLVRSIETGEFAPPHSEVRFIRARGPFTIAREIALLQDWKIDLLIAKNSGGNATYAKIEAARRLNIPVLMIDRPERPDCHSYSSLDVLLTSLPA